MVSWLLDGVLLLPVPQLPGASEQLCSPKWQAGPSPEKALLEEELAGLRGHTLQLQGPPSTEQPGTLGQELHSFTAVPGPYATAGLGLG